MGNVLEPVEICPGVTYRNHAESLAMFFTHNDPDETYDAFLRTLADSIEVSLHGDLAIFQDAHDEE